VKFFIVGASVWRIVVIMYRSEYRW